MIKYDIKYTDFNGESQVETAWFHLSKSELVTIQAGFQEDPQSLIRRWTKTNNQAEVIAIVKQLILGAYGVKSDDGKRFIKTDEQATEFSQTAAYDQLFMDLATNDKIAAEWIKGVLPADMQDEAEAVLANPLSPPSLPTPPPPTS